MGIELAQGHAFPATLTQNDFATNLQPSPTTPKLWAARQELLPPEDGHMCQCRPGEARWLATRLALIASRDNSLRGSDVYRINDPIKTAETWQKAAALKYASFSLQGKTSNYLGGEKLRHRKRKIQNGSMTLAG